MARVVRYMEGQGAGQCGPCVHGLSALADKVEALAYRPNVLRGRLDPVIELCSLVEGRGACRHPDGVARVVTSGCKVFGDHIGVHLRHGACSQAQAPPAFPVPRLPGGSREVPRW
jgi:NADH:ubiquinone oxidoreductase subunit F (NADH-binding)